MGWLARLMFARPRGLIQLRGLIFPGTPAQARHGRLLVAARGAHARLPWGLLQLGLWLKWLAWDAWRECWGALRYLGRDMARAGQLSMGRQGLRLGRLAFLWCVPPQQAYFFGLMSRPARFLDYVFQTETQAFHQLWNRTGPDFGANVALLKDKDAALSAFRALGVQGVPRLFLVRTMADCRPAVWLEAAPDGVFCKSRRGFGGTGSFALRSSAAGIAGQFLEGWPLNGEEAARAAMARLLALGEVMVEPLLQNHPALAPLAVDGSAITLKLISIRDQHGIEPLVSYLHFAGDRHPGSGFRHGYILPVDHRNGVILDYPPQALPVDDIRAAFGAARRRLAPQAQVPDWDVLVSQSIAAHGALPGIRAVNWDWVVTPDGPRLLEGNSHWGLEEPQVFLGGFLGDAFLRKHGGGVFQLD